jgi:hypothetical protein
MLATSLLLSIAWANADFRPSQAELRAAVAKAVPLLEKGTAGHMANRTCFACHNQGVPVLAVVTARSRGFAIDESLLRKNMEFINAFLDTNRTGYQQGRGQGGQAATAGHALWTMELSCCEGNETTSAVTDYLLQTHRELTYWRATSQRPPSEGSPFTTSFLALRGLQFFGTKEQQPRIDQRVRVVRDWLLHAQAKDTEDRVFRLWALKTAGAHLAEVQRAAQEILNSQRLGGGWAQLDTLPPDAYATGSALVALHEAGGLTTADPAYQRGLRFLLKSQLPDGSWHVASRSRPFQTYFETGFPHGKDQFISSAASAWAATSLALACK